MNKHDRKMLFVLSSGFICKQKYSLSYNERRALRRLRAKGLAYQFTKGLHTWYGITDAGYAEAIRVA